ncbi:protein of unknown function (plasmid) [Pararobbsia alpina]
MSCGFSHSSLDGSSYHAQMDCSESGYSAMKAVRVLLATIRMGELQSQFGTMTRSRWMHCPASAQFYRIIYIIFAHETYNVGLAQRGPCRDHDQCVGRYATNGQ